MDTSLLKYHKQTDISSKLRHKRCISLKPSIALFITRLPHCVCCSPGSSRCSGFDRLCGNPALQCWSLSQSNLDSGYHTASRALLQEWSTFKKGKPLYFLTNIFSDPFIFDVHVCVCVEAAGHYLQPVIETYWAFLCVHAINIEVGEVKRDCEAALNRNDVLTGYRLS